MPDIKNNIKVIYDALAKEGYNDLGSEQAFAESMADENNRKLVYNTLKDKGFSDVKDYDSFSSMVYQRPNTNGSTVQAVNPNGSDLGGILPKGQGVDSQPAPEYLKVFDARQIPEDFKVEGDFVNNPIVVGGKERTMGDVANELYRGYDNDYRTTENKKANAWGRVLERAKAMGLDEDQAAQLAGGVDKLYRQNLATDLAEGIYQRMYKEGDPLTNVEDVLYDKDFSQVIADTAAAVGYNNVGTYIEHDLKPALNNMLQKKFGGYNANLHRIATDIDDIRARVSERERKKAEEDRLRKQVEEMKLEGERLQEQGTAMQQQDRPWWAGFVPAAAGGINAYDVAAQERRNPDADRMVRTGRAIQYMADDAQAAINEDNILHTQKTTGLTNQIKNAFGRVIRGGAHAIADVRTWDFGFTELNNATAVKAAADAYAKNKATAEQKTLLNAVALKNVIMSKHGEALEGLYGAGTTTVQMVPFMAQFAFSPAKGVGPAAQKYCRGQLEKTFGKYATEAVGKFVVKGGELAGRFVGDLAQGAAMTTTFNMADVAADTKNRMTGDLEATTDDKGNIIYSGKRTNAKSGGRAFAEAFAARTIENQSELVGEYFTPLLSFMQKGTVKALDKLGLNKTKNFLTGLNNKEIVKGFNTFVQKTQWHGTLGEYGEEVVGNIENALFVGDLNMNLDTEDDNSVFSKKLNYNTFLGVALGGGIISTAHTANYLHVNRKVTTALNDADVHGDVIFGTERWEEIKSEIENAPDEKAGELLKTKMESKELNDDQKKTIAEYTKNLYIKRGSDISQLKNALEGNVSAEQEEAMSAYENGHNATDEQLNEVKVALDDAEKNASELLGEETLDVLDEIEDVDTFKNSDAFKSYTREQKEAAVRYMIARTAYKGMIERVQDDINSAVNKSNAEIDNLTHKESESIIRATLKDADREVYIVSGNVAMSADGKNVDTEKSDKNIVVYDAQKGKKEMLDIHDFLSVDTPIDAESYKADRAEEVKQEIAQREAARIDGVRTFHYDDVVKVQDKDGNLIDGVVQDVQGDEVVVVSDAYQGGKTYTAAELTAMQPQPQTVAENATVEQQAEEAVAGNESNEVPVRTESEVNSPQAEIIPQQQTVPNAETKTETETAQPTEQSSIPTDEKGNLLYHQAPVELTIKELYDGTLDDAEIADFVSANIEAAQKEYDKVAKKAPKIGTDKGKYLQEKKAYQEEVAEVKRKVDYWEAVEAARQELTHTTKAEIEAKESELNGDAARSEYQDGRDTDDSFVTAEDMTRDFLRDAKITPESFREETGLGVAEQRKFVGMISNQGDTIAKLGERLAEYDELHNGGIFFHGDSNEARSAIINAIIGSKSVSDFKASTDTTAEDKYAEEVERQRDEWYYNNYHLTYEEYLQYEETLLPELLRKYANFAEEEFYRDCAVIFEEIAAQENTQTIKTEDNDKQGTDTTAEEQRTDRSTTVLSGEKTGNSGRDSQSQEQGREVQTGLQGEVENATVSEAAQGEVDKEPLSEEEAQSLITSMEENAIEDPEISLTPKTWLETFGINNSIDTPIGKVRMGENQYAKLQDKKRTSEFGMVSLTLSDPDVIFVEPSEAKGEDVAERNFSYVFAKTFKRNGNKVKYYTSVTVSIDGLEISVSSHFVNPNKMLNKLMEFNREYTKETLFSNSSEMRLAEHQSDVPDLLPTQENNVSSIGKDTQSSQTKQENEDKFAAAPRKEGESILDFAERVATEHQSYQERKEEEAKVDTNPTDAQKEAGNYKKGHIKVDGLNITIEQPKGSIRRGTDANGKQWESEMHNTYGYIRGTESVDGDHIDIFLSDNPTEGNVFVVDQINKDGSFDEHKVMYGFPDMESAKQAYLSNYEEGWQGLGSITEVKKEDFKKWIDSSKRKTKPFAEYSTVKTQGDVQTKKPTEAEDFTRQDLKELEDFQKNTDTTGRTAIDIDRYDAEDLFAPLKLDGKPSNLGVLTVVPDKITDPAAQIAVYDYSDEIDDKTNSGWQKWGDLADEYNKTVDKDDKAQERGDTATLGFRTVDAAVKFSDWLNTDGQTKHQTKKTKKESKDNNVFLSQKEYVEKELKSVLKQTRYKTLEEWESKDIGDYSEKYDSLLDTYEDYVRDLADDERLQAIYDKSSVKAQKEMREHLTDADLDYHEFINTSPKRIRIQERLTRKSKYAKGEFSDGTIVSGEVVRWSPESLTVSSRGTLYTINANKVLQQSDKPMNADEHEYQRDASLQYSGETLANDTEAKQKAIEVVLAALSKAGIEVVRATDEEAKALLSNSHATTLRTPQGTIYGWSVNGKIYLTEAGINPDTPIHEYTHLWAEAMMIKNKKGWNTIKALLKDNPIWNEVVADANYSNIADNEDAVASEVLSRISGKKNAAKMEEEAQRAIDEAKGVFEKARVTTILTNLKKALNNLWKWVSKNIFDIKEFSSINEVTDKVLYDLIQGSKLINDKSLIGVHNISEQKLRKVLKQGGFANPSIAVIDTDKQLHNDYGEISLILPSRKINKSTGKNVGTYEGDAWTPMYPIIEKQMSSDGSLIMHNDINSVPNEMQSEVSNALNRWLDNGSDTDLSYLYLFQQGKAPKMATVKPKYSNEVYKSLRDIMFGVDSVYNLTKGEVKNLVELYVQTELNGDIDEYNKANERRIAKYKDAIENGRTNSMYYKIAERNLEEVKKYGYPLSSLKIFADDVQRDKTKQGSKNVQKTLNAASQIIKDAGLEEDFKNWAEGLNNRYQTKEFIFDGFTPTGKRRYIPNTLENVSKLMKKQGRQASTGLGVSFSNFAASVMKANGSLANIRKKKSKLTNEHKDIEDFEEKWKEVYFDLAMKLQPNASTFDDYGFTRLQEAALEADPQAYLSKEYGVTLSKEDVRKLQQMVKAIQEERPAMYFETKFERPVTLNEFSKAVVPEDLSDDLQKTLRDNGIEIFTYKRGDAEDRQKATQEAAYSSDDIAFQIIDNSKNSELIAINEQFNKKLSVPNEEKLIVEKAKADGTYMKAPNGKPTKLNERQWIQVRTQAFKSWFGDWEKTARIEKLRKSKPIKITGEEIEPSNDLKQYKKNALEYGKKLRGEYTNEYTKETIALTGGNKRGDLREILQHDYKDIEHLQSIAAIPNIIKKSIFIDEVPNEDIEKYSDVKSFRYYVCGLKIGNNDYTVKAVVAVQRNGHRYYDHKLSSIEKGKLLSIIPTIQKAGIENNLPPSIGKDKRLLSILQTNSSKVVDENGEPMVVYHGTLANGLHQFNKDFIGSRFSYDDKGFFFIGNENIAKDYATSEFDASRKGEVIDAYLSLKNPLIVNSDWCRKNGLGQRVFEDNDVIEFWDNYQSLLIEESENNDGIVITDDKTTMAVAFEPNQIKSATENNGDFSKQNDDVLYRTVFGGNSGYVGYSLSKRAAEAKEEGRYPKTEFKKEYHITEKSLDALTRLGFIDNSEWHHTSMYGNKTPFYGWVEDEFAEDYLKHKKEIDSLCKGIDPKTKQPLLEKTDKLPYKYEYEIPQHAEAEEAINLIKKWRNEQLDAYDKTTGFKGYTNATEEEKVKRESYMRSLRKQMEKKIAEKLAKDFPEYLAAKTALDAYNNYEENLRKVIGERVKEYLDLDKYSQRWREGRDIETSADVEELIQHAIQTARSLNLDNVEIVADGSIFEDKKATAKGFYNKKTGKITIIAGNHIDIADIEKTVLHEGVAHYGLRKLFGDNLNAFLDTVIVQSEEYVRRKIAEMAAKHEWSFRTAAEEYLAEMAEDANFEQLKPTTWQRIKRLFGEMMSALGLHHSDVTDNDLRYLLWRSYKNLENGGKRSILDMAEDIAMQYRLKVGNYAHTQSGYSNSNILYRSSIDPTENEMLPDAHTRYEKETKEPDKINSVPKTHNFSRRFYKSYVDSMLALKSYMNSVLEATGDKLSSHEDVYKVENAMTSKNKTHQEAYERDYYNPMIEAGRKLCEAVGMNYDALKMYIVAKHGLERNKYMGERAARNDKHVLEAQAAVERAKKAFADNPTNDNEEAIQAAQDAYELLYEDALVEYSKRDYSGLTDLTDEEDVAVAERKAQELVDKVEQQPNAMPKVNAFWKKVNAATKATLRTGYESGIMTKEAYEHIAQMYKYYIPLRGWDEAIASDIYTYYGGRFGTGQPLMKTAGGRSSLAEDPLAMIEHMAQRSIIAANRNKMKQAFLNFTLNHPSNLASVSEQWYVKNALDEWERRDAVIPADATPDKISKIVAEHEQEMQALAEQGKAIKQRNGLKLDKRVLNGEGAEHTIKVWRGGKEYVIYINGNPAVAQAVNGLTNPDVRGSMLPEWAKIGLAKLKNFLSAVYTSLNPAFVFKNFVRDQLFASQAVYIKYGLKYKRQATKNAIELFATGALPKLVYKWEHGTLDTSNQTEKLFDEFMRYGGETGFTALRDIEAVKKDIENVINGNKENAAKRGWKAFLRSIEFANRSAEDFSRFVTYMTSRQQGKGIVDAIYDAKDITVNFNKKGSGEMGARYMNFAYVFFNAAVQSINNFATMAKQHPARTALVVSKFGSLGFGIPMMNAFLMAVCGGDDERYWDNMEWIRRNNILLYVPFTKDTFISIPLPHELRPFYGMGEIATSILCGKETLEGGFVKALEGFTGMLPIDFTGNGGDLATTLTPTVGQPLAQWKSNTDFFGRKIYNDSDNKNTKFKPEWTKAFSTTPPLLVDITEALNNWTGGNRSKRGRINLNPDVINHLVKGYFGGTAKFVTQMSSLLYKGFSGNTSDIQWRDIPVGSNFVQQLDERSYGSIASGSYKDFTEEAEETEFLISDYKKQVRMGYMEYAEKITELLNSPEYRRYKIAKAYEKPMDLLRETLKHIDDPTDREAVNSALRGMRRRMMETAEIERGKNYPVHDDDFSFTGEAIDELGDALKYSIKGLKQGEQERMEEDYDNDAEEYISENKEETMRIIGEFNKLLGKKKAK